MSGYRPELVEQAQALGIVLPSERKPPRQPPRSKRPAEPTMGDVRQYGTNWAPAEFKAIEWLKCVVTRPGESTGRFEEIGDLILKLSPPIQWDETTDGFGRKIRWRILGRDPNQTLHDLSVELKVPIPGLRRWRNAALKRQKEER